MGIYQVEKSNMGQASQVERAVSLQQKRVKEDGVEGTQGQS